MILAAKIPKTLVLAAFFTALLAFICWAINFVLAVGVFLGLLIIRCCAWVYQYFFNIQAPKKQLQTHLALVRLENLQTLLARDTRKIILTMIHKFRDAPAAMNTRDNIIVLVDEAHLISDFLDAANFQTLALFDDLHEVSCLH